MKKSLYSILFVFVFLFLVGCKCNHTWDDGHISKESTCCEAGIKVFTCEKCGEQRSEAIDALGHKYENGVCTRCNENEPTDPPVVDPPVVDPPVTPPVEEGIEFNLGTNFLVYAKDWSTQYLEKALTNSEIGNEEKIKVVMSNASRQNEKVYPIIASKNTIEYVTISNFEGELNKVSFVLGKWSDAKKFVKLTIEYSIDGTTWVSCADDLGTEDGYVFESDVIIFSSNTLPSGVKYIRLVYAGNDTKNQQILLEKIILDIK